MDLLLDSLDLVERPNRTSALRFDGRLAKALRHTDRIPIFADWLLEDGLEVFDAGVGEWQVPGLQF